MQDVAPPHKTTISSERIALSLNFLYKLGSNRPSGTIQEFSTIIVLLAPARLLECHMSLRVVHPITVQYNVMCIAVQCSAV